MAIREIRISTNARDEFIDLTSKIRKELREMNAGSGILTVFVPHTTAAVTINENADPTVQTDIISTLDKLIPRRGNYLHAEGNSAAHVKSSLLGVSLQVPVENGSPVLGTWQGIFFCEFDGPRSRKVRLIFNP